MSSTPNPRSLNPELYVFHPPTNNRATSLQSPIWIYYVFVRSTPPSHLGFGIHDLGGESPDMIPVSVSFPNSPQAHRKCKCPFPRLSGRVLALPSKPLNLNRKPQYNNNHAVVSPQAFKSSSRVQGIMGTHCGNVKAILG